MELTFLLTHSLPLSKAKGRRGKWDSHSTLSLCLLNTAVKRSGSSLAVAKQRRYSRGDTYFTSTSPLLYRNLFCNVTNVIKMMSSGNMLGNVRRRPRHGRTHRQDTKPTTSSTSPQQRGAQRRRACGSPHVPLPKL